MRIDFERFLADSAFIWRPFVDKNIEAWHRPSVVHEISDEKKLITDPFVSIVVLTYNHKEMLTECIDSILMQKTSYTFEIIIADDCSPDGVTSEMAIALQKKYPDKIRVLNGDVNVGSARNAVRGLERCRGKYVACIDGDDYYLSEHKIQKQVSYLIEHPDVAVCMCSVYLQIENYRWALTPIRNATKRMRVARNNLSGGERANEFLRPSGCLPIAAFFRADSARYAVDKFNELFKRFDWVPSQDSVLMYFLVHTGKLYFSPEEMCVYRKNCASVTADKCAEVAIARQFGDWCDRLAMIQDAPSFITDESKEHVEYKVLEFLVKYVELKNCEAILSEYLLSLIHEFGFTIDKSRAKQWIKENSGGHHSVWLYLLRKFAIGILRL